MLGILKGVRILLSHMSPTRAFSFRTILSVPTFQSVQRPLSLGISVPIRPFSAKMRKVREKQQKGKGKFKLKSHSGFKKRFRIVGSLSSRNFKYKPAFHSHLRRNKTKRNLLEKRKSRLLRTYGDIRRARRLAPYFKRKSYKT